MLGLVRGCTAHRYSETVREAGDRDAGDGAAGDGDAGEDEEEIEPDQLDSLQGGMA